MIRRTFSILILLAGTSLAVTPTKHEWYVGPVDAALGTSQLQLHTVNPSASGDAVVIGFTYGSARSISSIKDNTGGIWNVAVTSTDVTNSQKMSIAYSTGTVGVSSVTVFFDAGGNYKQGGIIVLNNIATGNTIASIIDQTSGGRKTGTSIGCGPMTLGSAGDELIQFATSDGTLPNAMVNMTTATSNMAMFGVDSNDIFGGAYGNVASSGVTDSTITMSASLNSTVVACAAFKTASGGGSPGTGIYVQQATWINLNDPQNLLGQTVFKVDFPCQSDSAINLIDIGFHTSGSIAFSTITSSPANVWISTTNVAGNNKVGHLYAANAVVNSTMTITVTLTASPGATSEAFTETIWGISGALASPLDIVCSNHFSSAQTSGTVNNQPSCQTSGSNELLVAVQQEDRQTITGGSPGYQLQGDSGGAYSSLKFYQDGGAQHYYVASSSNVNVNWYYSYYEGGAAIGDNSGMAIAWNPAPVSSTPVLKDVIDGKLTISGVAAIQ